MLKDSLVYAVASPCGPFYNSKMPDIATGSDCQFGSATGNIWCLSSSTGSSTGSTTGCASACASASFSVYNTERLPEQMLSTTSTGTFEQQLPRRSLKALLVASVRARTLTEALTPPVKLLTSSALTNDTALAVLEAWFLTGNCEI